MKDPRDHLAPDQQHQRDEGGNLRESDAEGARDLPAGRRASRLCGAAEQTRHRRQQHQGQHHREILDDQPADRDAPLFGLDQMALLQGPQQHHGAGDRQRKAEHDREPLHQGTPARDAASPGSQPNDVITTSVVRRMRGIQPNSRTSHAGP